MSFRTLGQHIDSEQPPDFFEVGTAYSYGVWHQLPGNQPGQSRVVAERIGQASDGTDIPPGEEEAGDLFYDAQSCYLGVRGHNHDIMTVLGYAGMRTVEAISEPLTQIDVTLPSVDMANAALDQLSGATDLRFRSTNRFLFGQDEMLTALSAGEVLISTVNEHDRLIHLPGWALAPKALGAALMRYAQTIDNTSSPGKNRATNDLVEALDAYMGIDGFSTPQDAEMTTFDLLVAIDFTEDEALRISGSASWRLRRLRRTAQTLLSGQ